MREEVSNCCLTPLPYEDADGSLIRLTRENFPSKVLRFKAWSDENYHDVECEYHVYSDNTFFLEGISEMAVAVASVEDSLVADIEEQDRKAICRLLMSSRIFPDHFRRPKKIRKHFEKQGVKNPFLPR